MTVRLQSIGLDEIIAIKWRCPKCGSAVEMPVQRKGDTRNGRRFSIRSCPACQAHFMPDDPDSVAAYAWHGLEELIQKLQRYGHNFTLVVPAD